MNTKLFHNFERQDATPVTATKRKPKPITANPLFPFVTALWFATLLGLGSFATAPMLLEGPVIALGIPALIPAAAPPLGFTARIVFAIAMMGLGAIFGYSLGRFLGREKVTTPARTRGFGKNVSPASSSQARRPINAAQDLGAPLDSPIVEEPQTRLRAIIQNDEPPVVVSPAFIASPVEDLVEDTAVIEERQVFKPSVTTNAADPLGPELLLDEANVIDPAPFATSQPMFAAPQHVPEQPTAPVLFDPLEAEAEARAETPDPFMPPAFAKVEPAVAPEPALISPAPISTASGPSAFVPQTSFLQARAVDATPIDRAPLDNLGLVQLVERLAFAISRRAVRANPFDQAPHQSPEFVAAAPVAEPLIARFEQSPSAPPEPELPSVQPEVDHAYATPAFAQVQPERPERVVQLRPPALQPLQSFADDAVDFEAENEEPDIGLERFLRMSPLLARKPELLAEAFGVAHTPESLPEPEVAEDCYPSLLDMVPAVVRREPLRIDDSVTEEYAVIEPTVVFPGQETPRTAEAAWAVPTPYEPSQAAPVPAGARLFERPSVMSVPGSPLASPGRAAPSEQVFAAENADNAALPAGVPDAEEADRALRAALATLQRMTARG